MSETSSVKSQLSGNSAGKTSWPADHVERWPIERLIPFARNARTHNEAQVSQIASSIREWGWTNPVLVGRTAQSLLAMAAFWPRASCASPMSR